MFNKIFIILTMMYIVSGADVTDDMVNNENEFLIDSDYISNKENKLYDKNLQYLDRLFWSAQKIVNEQKTNYELYKNIIKKFVKKYIYCKYFYDNTAIGVEYNVPMDFKPEDIYDLCSDIDNKHTRSNDDNYFRIYKTLFIESAIFSLNTIKKISDMHKELNKDTTMLQNKIYDDPVLLENYIISINWLNSILYEENVINLLDIFDKFNICHNEATKMYCFSYKYEINYIYLPVFMTMNCLVECIKPYFKKNNFTSKQNILKNTCTQKINKWIDLEYTDEQEKYKRLYKKAFHCITLYRSMQTKINYLSKYSYTLEQYGREQYFDMTDDQKYFIQELRLETVVKDIYNTKFCTFRMHSDETIMKIFDLIPTFEKNIRQLIMYKEQINQILFNVMKTYFKKLIKKYFKDKRSNNISRKKKRKCMSAIKKIMVNTEYLTKSNTTDQRKILEKNVYEMFCDAFLSNTYIYNFNQKYSDLIALKINEVQKEIINYIISYFYQNIHNLSIEIYNMKEKVDEKRSEIVAKYNYTLFDYRKEYAMAIIRAGTLYELADWKHKEYLDSHRENILEFCDEILQIKRMIFQAEESIREILEEIKEIQIRYMKKNNTLMRKLMRHLQKK